MLPRVGPEVAEALTNAMSAVAHCSDLVARAGCRPAATYLDGAGGNLRHALDELVHRRPHLAPGAEDFDLHTVGGSLVLGTAGFPDTITSCSVDGGDLVEVRALIPSRDATATVWVRPTGELPGVHVRGSVTRGEAGLVFEDEQDRDLLSRPSARPDLGRDLASAGLDLSGRPAASAAMEVTLATGSWVHLASGARWYADHATARAIVRLLGGTPGVAPHQVTRLGICVDRACLLAIERVGWRHWPTPRVA
jgi:hypothetical protein